MSVRPILICPVTKRPCIVNGCESTHNCYNTYTRSYTDSLREKIKK